VGHPPRGRAGEGGLVVTRRRARPLLGTLVEVRAEAGSAERFEAAAEAAFAAVSEVQRLMSFHDETSDLRRIARARAGDRVHVHAHTATVLRRALRWARASAGAFDPGCAPRAVAAGWLPAPADGVAPGALPFERALSLRGREVTLHAPLWLDFGGIAKGYAVDRAVAAMRRVGLEAGAVNAGGDLRVFGPQEETVLVRSPFDASRLWPLAALRDAACATSASGAVAARDGSVAPAAGSKEAPPCSVTVLAPTACAADALTKIVWLRGREAIGLLRRSRARAFVVCADGGVWRA
jgi:thiamine biosynthesis lipoprotein